MTHTITNNRKDAVPSQGIDSQKRLYCIEFFRILFILFVVCGHAWEIPFPAFKKVIFSLLHTPQISYGQAVEFFYLIGGFFLYKRVTSGLPTSSLIYKTYMRLLPGMLVAFLVLVCIHYTPVSHFPLVLSLLGGTALDKSYYMGFGEYFISTYFWSTCLFISIFTKFPKSALLWLGIILFLSFTLSCHKQLIGDQMKAVVGNGSFDAYYGIFGVRMVRAIQCMGLGLIVGYLARVIILPRVVWFRITFTLIEGACTYCVFHHIIDTRHSSFSYLGILIVFSILLISISQSYGYFSAVLNKASWVQCISRYTLPVFFSQITVMAVMVKYKGFGLSCIPGMIIFLVAAIILGVIEYHVIEQYLVPKLKKNFASTNIADGGGG